MEALLDRCLTALFTPLRLLGIHKCSKCTVRVRLAQAGRIVTVPIQTVPAVRRARSRWDMVAHPEKRVLQPAKLPLIHPVKLPVDES